MLPTQRLKPIEGKNIEERLLDGMRNEIDDLKSRMDVVESWQKKRTHINPQQYLDAAVVVGNMEHIEAPPHHFFNVRRPLRKSWI